MVRLFFSDLKVRVKLDGGISLLGLIKVLRNTIIEFGLPEYFDSFVIRPVAMYYFPSIVNSVPLGLFLGKISADVTFYVPTIILYELRKKYIKD